MKLTKSSSFTIKPAAPFNFKLTVKKPAGWELFNREEVFENETLWTAMRFGGQPIGLRLRSTGSTSDPSFETTAFSKRRLSPQTVSSLKAHLQFLTGAEDDLTEFYKMARRDHILKHAVKDLYGMHDTKPSSIFDSVVLSICLQMATLKRTEQMLDSIDSRYGDTLEFDHRRLTLSPSPQAISTLDPQKFTKECNLGYRGKYIVRCAQRISEGFPDTLELAAMSPAAAKEKVMELPGIGDYSADIVNPHRGFPIDAWSVHVFSVLLFGRNPKNARDEIETVKRAGIKRWGKWSWMTFFYVAQDLENLSKRLGVQLRLV